MSMSPQDIGVEVDGVIYIGNYSVWGRTVIVTRGSLRKSAHVGEETPGTVARKLLAELIETEKSLSAQRNRDGWCQ